MPNASAADCRIGLLRLSAALSTCAICCLQRWCSWEQPRPSSRPIATGACAWIASSPRPRSCSNHADSSSTVCQARRLWPACVGSHEMPSPHTAAVRRSRLFSCWSRTIASNWSCACCLTAASGQRLANRPSPYAANARVRSLTGLPPHSPVRRRRRAAGPATSAGPLADRRCRAPAPRSRALLVVANDAGREQVLEHEPGRIEADPRQRDHARGLHVAVALAVEQRGQRRHDAVATIRLGRQQCVDARQLASRAEPEVVGAGGRDRHRSGRCCTNGSLLSSHHICQLASSEIAGPEPVLGVPGDGVVGAVGPDPPPPVVGIAGKPPPGMLGGTYGLRGPR